MHNLELEATVLSCMMNDYECAVENGLISIDDFTDKAYQEIFKAIRELTDKKAQSDYISIHNHLNKKIDLSFLIDISDVAPTTVSFKTYVKQLKDTTLKRNLIRLADKIKTENKTGRELSEFAESEIFKLRQTVQTNDFVLSKDIALDVIASIEEKYKREGIYGLSTGYTDIDRITNGLRKKDVIYLAARPSMGKTALALNIAQNASKKGNVAIFSLEMSKEDLIERMVMSEARVPSSKINKKKMDDDDWIKLTRAAQIIYNSNLNIYDQNNLKVGDMASMCRKLKKDKGLDLVIIDYLQLFPIKGDRYTGITNLSISLKGLAKELDCPVLILSQLSRKVEERNNKRPQMSDLRESGQIEQDADVIMFLYRDEYYNPETEDRGIAELIFAKQRNGPVGMVKLGWIAEFTTFVDYGLLERSK